MAASEPRQLALVTFTAEAMPLVEPWFDDPATRRWLGDRKWPAMALRLAHDPPTQHRGHYVVRRESFLALEQGAPVALLDAETYQDATAGFAFVVEPARRGQGVCRRAVLALAAHLASAGVRELFAGVESENLASMRCLAAAGFVSWSAQPDSEGFLYFARPARL